MSEIWKIIAGDGNRYIQDFEQEQCIAIGWLESKDLSNARTEQELANLYDETYPDGNASVRGNSLACISKFRFAMQVGDVVISYNPGTREYLWGEITGDYMYQPGRIGDYPHTRNVDWKQRISRDDLSKPTRNSLTTLLTITRPNENVHLELLGILSGKAAPSTDQEEIGGEEVEFRNQVGKAHELVKDRLTKLDWEEMQDLVAAILRAMGYKTRISPAGPDKGKDVIASPDGLGLEHPRIKVEVKHRKQQMGSQEIRSFLGGLRPGDSGLYVSTGGFSREAEYEAERANIPITLIDLDILAGLLVQHYDKLDTEGRALVPLTRIFWPTS